jgi:predicted ester cyclase
MDMTPLSPSAQIVARFYSEALTVNTKTTPAEVLGALLADGFTSQNGQESKDKATLIGQLGFMWRLIPDLVWTPMDIMVDGARVIVRSLATGTPKGDFLGLSLTGAKSFQIDTIDIHTVQNGQITHVYHLEDWATAQRQLS